MSQCKVTHCTGRVLANTRPYQGDWETGRLGDWETGRLGDWETGRLGDWETGRLGDWEIGRLGDWETGRLGDWETGNAIRLRLAGLTIVHATHVQEVDIYYSFLWCLK